MREPVIDAHVHLVAASEVFRREARRTGADNTLAGLRREMDASGIARAVLIAHWQADDGDRTRPFTNRTNNDLLAMLAEGGGSFRGLLTVNIADDGPVDLGLLEEHIARGDVAGVKFFTGYETFHADDPRCEPVYEMLERHRAVAMFHTGDTLIHRAHLKYAKPLPIDEVAVAHPRMNVVLAHAGQHWSNEAGELVGKDPNVHADVSGWFVGRDLPWFSDFALEQFRQLVFWADGCDKLMFGSDWPLMRMEPYLAFMDKCSEFLSKEEMRKILYENARRLYWPGD